ncbi:hypothetical protein F5887DRAFT_1124985 [Amanita rubescens]|nr:hypothetical protein F5887DRAFT_1124985 [Amanita rubescens]
MDNGFEDAPGPQLSYDDSVPYNEQVSSLAERISSTKVYLLADASNAKRKPAEDIHNGGGEDEMETDQGTYPLLRGNAILLQGPPIAHLPTARIFDYAAHFDIHPLGLEWVDDNTCIFVFPSKALATSAFLALQKPATTSETPSTTTMTTSRPIPISLWPPEDRIHHSLGVGQGLRGTMHMRWARVDDKKKRGAKKDSAFYRKHGVDAGKEKGVTTLENRISSSPPGRKRKRGGKDDIDEFLADDEEPATEPPSKMRSDYIAQTGRITARLPKRPRAREGNWAEDEEAASRRRGGRRRGRNRAVETGGEPPRKKTREELDEELEAFLNDRT